jgi:L-iditol 2-dehydrogenase
LKNSVGSRFNLRVKNSYGCVVRAAVLVGAEELEVMNFELPKVAAGAMLVKLRACGVCASDIHIYHGRLRVPFPIILGHELSGTVEELGPEANSQLRVHGGHLEVGDNVTVVPGLPCGQCFYCKNFPELPNLCSSRLVYGINRSCADPPHLYGGYSEYLYVEPGSWVYKLPPGMPPELAALAEPAAVSTRALRRGLVSLGKAKANTVVVQGLGAIGLLATAAAKLAGARLVVGVDRVKQRLEMALKLGADEVIDMRQYAKPEDRVRRILELSGGVGSDLTLECTGVPEAFREGIEFTRRGGKYVEVGHYTDSGSVEVNPHTICYRDMDILGSWVYPMWQFGEALELLRSRRFPFEKIFTHRFKIEDAEHAIKASERGECIRGLIVP